MADRFSAVEAVAIGRWWARRTAAGRAPTAGRVTVREYGERWRAMQVHGVTGISRSSTGVKLPKVEHVYPTPGSAGARGEAALLGVEAVRPQGGS